MKRTDVLDFVYNTNDTTIDRMRKEAFELHDVECNQKYSDHPYSYHLDMVFTEAVDNLHEVCLYEYHILPILFAALFHDAIEDARVTYNDIVKIAEKYMSHYRAVIAAEIVYALTDDKGRTRKERASDKHFEEIRNTMYAPFVKWCDRYANTKYSKGTDGRMFKVYKREMSDFLARLGGDRFLSKELIDKIEKLVEE